jgi:hypothetical protein
MASKPENDDKSNKDDAPRRPQPLSTAYAFYYHYLTDQHRETIGPFSILTNTDTKSLIFSFPVREFAEKLHNDLRHARDHLSGLKSKAQVWKRHISSNPEFGKGYLVERVRPEFQWRKKEMEHLRKAVAEAKNAVEMKLQEWVEAERVIKKTLEGLEGTLAAIDGLPEDGET